MTGDNRLPILAARIKTEHEAAGAALRTSLAHATAAGEALLEAKQLMSHGEWLPWLRNTCDITERTAQRYMRVAKNRAVIKNDTVSDLTMSGALAVLATPRESVRPVDKLVGGVIEALADETALEAALKSRPDAIASVNELSDPHKLEVMAEGRRLAARVWAAHAVVLEEFEKMLRARKAFVTDVYDKFTAEERDEFHRRLKAEGWCTVKRDVRSWRRYNDEAIIFLKWKLEQDEDLGMDGCSPPADMLVAIEEVAVKMRSKLHNGHAS